MKVTGTAIHSGLTSTVTLHRADGPIRFRRAGTDVVAHIDNVMGAARATSLTSRGAQVHLVEHLLAALAIRGFYSGVVAEVSCDELPILDGSAAPWLPAIDELGPPPAAPTPVTVTEPVQVNHNGGTVRFEPGPATLDCSIDFTHRAIGKQRVVLPEERWHELLHARTFGMLAEWEALKSRGLALGAGFEHAIVFDDVGPVRPLRHVDEPVRHKALDAIGDLALLGRPLAAHIIVSRGSHALHHEAVRQLMRRLAPEVDPA